MNLLSKGSEVMKEIKVGEYIRTTKGQIDKFKEYGEEELLVRCENKKYWKSNIVKHNSNIIELLEVGDYVNGSRVVGFAYDGEKSIKKGVDEKIGVIVEERWELTKYFEKDIKSIVTKEQFETMKYEVVNDARD